MKFNWKSKLPNRQQIRQLMSGFIEKALILLVLAYIIFSVGRSVYNNYQMNTKIDKLRQELRRLDQEKAYLRNLIAYYKTETFKELKAREELGYQRPGEKVLSVPVEEGDIPFGEADSFKDSFVTAQLPEVTQPIPNYQKWFWYFFGS